MELFSRLETYLATPAGDAAILGQMKVVVVGAGYAGAKLGVLLRNAGVQVKIINKTEYFHHCCGALRAAVVPEFSSQVAVSLRDLFGEDFIQGSAIKIDIDRNIVVLESGEEVGFSHCVVAVGSEGPVPARSTQESIAGLADEYKRIADTIAKATSVVIVGGGPVGVEFSGEIRERFADVDISLVASRKELVCQDFGDKFQNNLKYILDKQNIQVVVGRVENLDSLKTNTILQQKVKVSSGEELQADLVFSCVGLPVSKCLTSLLPGKLDSTGRVKVNKFLQVEDTANIFAIGDCCNTKEDKMAAFAGKHAELVANNLVKLASGKQMVAYVSFMKGMMIPLGSKAGVGNINAWNIPGFIVTKVKSSDLMTGMIWGGLGVRPPAY